MLTYLHLSKIGVISSEFLQNLFTNSYDYPIIIQGKIIVKCMNLTEGFIATDASQWKVICRAPYGFKL